MITTIIKILTTPKAAAELCVACFGEGTANPDAPIIEEFIAKCMTPPQQGYTRVIIDDEFTDALEYLMAEYESTDVEVVSIERDGQVMFQVGFTDGGIFPEYLGLHNGIPMYHEPEVI